MVDVLALDDALVEDVLAEGFFEIDDVGEPEEAFNFDDDAVGSACCGDRAFGSEVGGEAFVAYF